MAEPTEPTTETTAAAQPTEIADPSAAPAPEAPLTASAVRAMMAEELRKARDAGAADARRAIEAKQANRAPAPTAPKNEATTPPPSGNDAEFAEVLADALNEFPFDKEQRRAIRDAARSKKPEDVDGFVAQWARMFGKSPGAAPSPTQPNQPAPAAKPAASIPNTPPPAGTPTDGSASPIFRAMSEEDRRDAFNAYIRRSGGNPANLRAPETRKALGLMRRDFETAAAITTVSIGARPTR